MTRATTALRLSPVPAALALILLAVPAVAGAALLSPVHGAILAPAATPRWSLVNTTASSPPTRQSGSMVFDPVANEFVLFGGAANGSALGDTWIFAKGKWTDLTPSLAKAPAARWYFGMTWDPAMHGVLLFGGRNGVTDFNDTWVFSGRNWSQLATRTAPPPITTSRMVYDSADHYVVLFGGFSIMAGAPSMYNFTWDFANRSWHNITSIVRGAPPDVHITTYAVYDPSSSSVLMFGGSTQYASSCTTPGFTWSYSAGVYRNLSSNLSTAPPLGGGGSRMMAYDPALRGVVLYGGWGGTSCGTYSSETWLYSSGAWHHLHEATNPGPLWDGAMASDTTSNVILLFSGNTGVYSSSQSSGTWKFA